MRGSPDAVLTPSLTFPTLNLTAAYLPHISSSTGSRPVHGRTRVGRQFQSRTVNTGKHFSHRLHFCLLVYHSLHILPLSFFSLCIWERSFFNQSSQIHTLPPPQGGCVDTACICSLSRFQALQGLNDKAQWQPQGPANPGLILHVIFNCSGTKHQASALELLCK